MDRAQPLPVWLILMGAEYGEGLTPRCSVAHQYVHLPCKGCLGRLSAKNRRRGKGGFYIEVFANVKGFWSPLGRQYTLGPRNSCVLRDNQVYGV